MGLANKYLNVGLNAHDDGELIRMSLFVLFLFFIVCLVLYCVYNSNSNTQVNNNACNKFIANDNKRYLFGQLINTKAKARNIQHDTFVLNPDAEPFVPHTISILGTAPCDITKTSYYESTFSALSAFCFILSIGILLNLEVISGNTQYRHGKRQ